VVTVSPVKLAVTLAAPVIVMVCGDVRAPRLPLKPVKAYPLAADALISTTVPPLYQPLAGEMVPPPEGLTAVVR
jgi:hypothetical protein